MNDQKLDNSLIFAFQKFGGYSSKFVIHFLSFSDGTGKIIK